MNKKIFISVLCFIFTFVISLSYWWLASPRSLTFSDSARYADAARSIVETGDSVIHHSYFSLGNLLPNSYLNGWKFNSSPVTIKILSLAFQFFPINDLTIAMVGITFFSLSSIIIFLLASNLHSVMAGLVSVILFTFNTFFLEYAVNNTSEIYLILEILLATWFIFAKKSKKILIFFPLLLMFFTRPQAPIFVFGLVAFYIIHHLYQHTNKPLKLTFNLIMINLFLFIAIVVLLQLIIVKQWSIGISHIGSILIPTNVNPGEFLRGSSLSKTGLSFVGLISKTFYNSYNFLKEITRLMSPGIFWIFILGVFTTTHKKISKVNLLASLSFILFVIAASITLPNARYVHPATPLLIIGASTFIVNLLQKRNIKYQIVIVSFLLMLITLPVWGNIFIDYRFRSENFNLGKPTIYQEISKEFKKHTQVEGVVLTNLDAWGAWYSKLTTMWFPLSPDDLIKKADLTNLPQYIAITNYKEHDGDFTLGQWQEVVYSPDQISNQFLNQHYSLLTTFVIPANQIYENKSYQGTILIKK